MQEDGEQRTPPLKELEGALRYDKEEWRNGVKMRNIMCARKAIFLAYERRILGHPLSPSAAPHDPMTPDQAADDLEVLARCVQQQGASQLHCAQVCTAVHHMHQLLTADHMHASSQLAI